MIDDRYIKLTLATYTLQGLHIHTSLFICRQKPPTQQIGKLDGTGGAGTSMRRWWFVFKRRELLMRSIHLFIYLSFKHYICCLGNVTSIFWKSVSSSVKYVHLVTVWWALGVDECKFPASSAPGVVKSSINMHPPLLLLLHAIFIKDEFFHDDFREQIIFA